MMLGIKNAIGALEPVPYVIEAGCRFDVIFLGQTIEHLNEPVKAVRRLASLLRPGGLLVLSTPNLDSARLIATSVTW